MAEILELTHPLPRLGEVLLTQESIREEDLLNALSRQHKRGGKLGEILLDLGLLSPLRLQHALAEQAGFPLVMLDELPCDPLLMNAADLAVYFRLRAVPWRRDEHGRITLAICEWNEKLRRWVRQRYGEECSYIFITPRDLRDTLAKNFAQQLSEESILKLWRINPILSARLTLLRTQSIAFAMLLAGLIACSILYPATALLSFVWACNIVYTATMLFKWLLFTVGRKATHNATIAPALPDSSLPTYTILVPLYREAAALPGLIQNLRALNYPHEKLDIKLLCEADDQETMLAARRLRPPGFVEILCVPSSQPRTKPKACNYGLRFARGELVTVFDAEDRPEPDQLRKAATRLHTNDVFCVQARLDYYNARENWMSKLFTLEYSLLFRFFLPGLEKLGIPIPLGGTSNHMRLSRLHLLGEWDPFNVTEDADMGIRIAATGHKTAMIDSTTWEESPIHLGVWLRQRSRWIKGYMQTWLVHMREPLKLYRHTGSMGFFGFQFFVGFSCFVFLTAPILWAVSALWLIAPTGMPQLPMPWWLGVITLLNLLFNFALHWAFAWHAATAHPKAAKTLRSMVFFFPFYWVLHSAAAYKALWQLAIRPHYWEKTTHGLTELPS